MNTSTKIAPQDHAAEDKAVEIFKVLAGPRLVDQFGRRVETVVPVQAGGIRVPLRIA